MQNWKYIFLVVLYPMKKWPIRRWPRGDADGKPTWYVLPCGFRGFLRGAPLVIAFTASRRRPVVQLRVEPVCTRQASPYRVSGTSRSGRPRTGRRLQSHSVPVHGNGTVRDKDAVAPELSGNGLHAFERRDARGARICQNKRWRVAPLLSRSEKNFATLFPRDPITHRDVDHPQRVDQRAVATRARFRHRGGSPSMVAAQSRLAGWTLGM
ncbi:hypothetical protein AWB68_00863 [Caballeronia choica]|uniref:Uncharacterized protein n=1 Tax=Caballeronia choica TaxID=326476 RepID=A0A158FQ60_9BURK|nr:hypothetical protein AWB68_00863 [Caballeronia choica]